MSHPNDVIIKVAIDGIEVSSTRVSRIIITGNEKGLTALRDAIDLKIKLGDRIEETIKPSFSSNLIEIKNIIDL